MLEIVFAACSLLQAQCREVHLTFASDSVSHFECMLYGQSAIAQWTISNPNWSPKRGYRCGRTNNFARA